MSTTKERKENDQAMTIDKNSDPGRHKFYYKRKKENDQAATIDNNSGTRATINNNNLPLPRKSNNKPCVVVVKLE
jgi:hypothetical protein